MNPLQWLSFEPYSCPSCGLPLREWADKCPVCAAPIEKPQAKPAWLRGVFVIILWPCAVLFILVGAYFILAAPFAFGANPNRGGPVVFVYGIGSGVFGVCLIGAAILSLIVIGNLQTESLSRRLRPRVQPYFCPLCGVVLERVEDFCPTCGAVLKRFSVPFWVRSMAALVLVLVAVPMGLSGVFFLFDQGSWLGIFLLLGAALAAWAAVKLVK